MVRVMIHTAGNLDEGSGHAIGIGVAFFGLATIFVLGFLLMVWVGRMRDRRRGGPRPYPQLPLLGNPEDPRPSRRGSRRGR